MNANEFIKLVRSFADNPQAIDISKGNILVQVRDEDIYIQAIQKDMNIYVIENNNQLKAETWIINRLARLPQLADRLIDYTSVEPNFVTPKGKLLDQLESNPDETTINIDNAVLSVTDVLDRRSAFCSSVLYVTSDAGEGKTTLINQIAKKQALAYKNKATDWLLIPIPLGGRPFLRFDDIVIASLVNNYRFPFLYWDTFLELVKIGVLIPAFDGFEEMFVESSTGEALSALGTLLNRLESTGTMLIAARKAYFDFKSLASQARLFDTIHADSVSFARIAIDRWQRDQFLLYAKKRSIKEPEYLFEKVSQKVGSQHPILTRAVLVRRLIDVAEKTDDCDDLIQKLGDSPHDFFSNFVDAIIEREVRLKWIDRTGEAAKPLLTLNEHHTLLSMIAQEMWCTNTESLKGDILDLLSEMFTESTKKDPRIALQIRERLKQHALLVKSSSSKDELSFDHEEFKQFFLGKALATMIAQNNTAEAKSILRVATLPSQAAESAVHSLKQARPDITEHVLFLQTISKGERPVSFIRENCGLLISLFLDIMAGKDFILEDIYFPVDSLCCKKLSQLRFKNCYFKATSLEQCELKDCSFADCTIERVSLSDNCIMENVNLENTIIESVVLIDRELELFDPGDIKLILKNKGFQISDTLEKEVAEPEGELTVDEDLVITERVLRRFIRSTQINENIFRMRLSHHAAHFFDNILPILLENGILSDVQYLGGGRQKRYKLSVSMNDVNCALAKSKGNFNSFISFFKELNKQ